VTKWQFIYSSSTMSKGTSKSILGNSLTCFWEDFIHLTMCSFLDFRFKLFFKLGWIQLVPLPGLRAKESPFSSNAPGLRLFSQCFWDSYYHKGLILDSPAGNTTDYAFIPGS
jgi:hypothetical protein